MTYLRISLVVITLLQLCRAEISDKQPESWYAANVINDGFQPKPISEIFSTEASFSSTNPIIVLSKSNEIPDEIALLSTLPPTRSHSSTKPEGFTSMPTLSSTASSGSPSGPQPVSMTSQSSPPLPTFTIIVAKQTDSPESTSPEIITPVVQPERPDIQPVLPLVTDYPMLQPSAPEVPPNPSVIPAAPPIVQPEPPVIQPVPLPAQLDPSIPQSVQPIILPVQGNNAQPSRSQSAQTQSQQIRLELIPPVQSLPNQPASNQPQMRDPQIVTQAPVSQTSTLSPLSNYFLIYQQAPQNIQNYPLPPQTSISTSQSPTVSVATLQTTTEQNNTTIMPQPTPTVSAPSVPSSPPQTVPPTTINTVPTARPLPITTIQSTNTTTTQPTVIAQNTASLLPSSETTPIPRTMPPVSSYPLRIRVIAPVGSITNVRINPTTTTKKPKTVRTRKPKPKVRKNSYDVCIESCKGRRDPICAAPLSPGVIDPNNLKGFPSICHMACHNSFRKDAYEKLVDGRCGKLRTRIRTVDSKTKLKRDELNKAEYTLDNTGSKTIVEFSGSIN